MPDGPEPAPGPAPEPAFVSRGGLKLHHALNEFRLSITGTVCADLGCSTGGFTDCLLQHGAAEVVAIDVGYGQLHERLRTDDRVRNLERTNVRHVGPADIGGPCDLVVADLSFISLTTVAPALFGLLRPGGDLLALVKPQFEAGRQEASRGRGVIRSPEVWRRVLGEVGTAVRARGATMMGAMVSPITGADGNVEFLVHAAAGALPTPPEVDLDAVVATALERHHAR